MDVFLALDPSIAPSDREDFLKRLRASFEVIEDDGALCLPLPIADPNMALSRAQDIVRGLCEGTDIDPSLIRRSVERGWSG